MRKIHAQIAELEKKLGADFNEYKKEHPGTHKTPGDPMFHPAYGQAKPHLSHEDMLKLSPREHQRLEKEHQTHAMNASKKSGDARRGNDKEQSSLHRDLGMKHGEMAQMHGMYALGRTGKEDIRPGAVEAAKKRHAELSSG